MEKIKSHIKNSKLSDKRAEELFNITEQNFTFSEDDHEGEYYKNKAKDLFYRDENDYFLKELWFPKDYNKNFTKIMFYMNQLTLNNSVVIVGINNNTITNYSLNETDFLIFQDLKKTSNDSNIIYSDHNLEDLKLKIISDEEFKFPEYSNKFISIYKDASKIEKGSISNNDDYVPIEAEDNKEPFIKFYFIRDTSFQLPKVYINLYFFHPFLRANYSDSTNENEFLFFNMMMYISYIQREINFDLSDAIRSGNMIKVGFSENYIFIDIFAYSDLVENIVKIIKGIIVSAKEKLKEESNFILSRDYAIEEFLNFEKVDLRQKLNYKYFKFLTSNDSNFPPIYNYYEFNKTNYENSTNTTKNIEEFNYLNFPILRGFILGYYEKEEALKIYNIFHSNFSDNFISTIDRANYNATNINPIAFMTSCLRRNMSTNTSIIKDPLINDQFYSAYSYMYFAEYSHKSRIAVETLIKLFQRIRGFRISRVNQKHIYLIFSFNKTIFSNTSVLKKRILKEMNDNQEFIKTVDIVGDKYYYIMKNVESELSQKTFTMREMAIDYSYSKLYNISGSFPYEITKYDYTTFKNAIADIFGKNKYFYELNNNTS